MHQGSSVLLKLLCPDCLPCFARMGSRADLMSQGPKVLGKGSTSSDSGNSRVLEIRPRDAARSIRALAGSLAMMEVTRPAVLRATAAYHAFESCAAALRGTVSRDFFAKSREVPKIQEFWSHSWHSPAWAKCLTLLVLNNGLAAICVGHVFALLGIVLFHLHALPGFDRHSEGQGNSSVWSSTLGAAGTILTLACWKSRKEVFLDRICISQTETDLKTEAIRSLAGILNKSESMLVLWDDCFAERLWCMFEIAAFLKSKKKQERPLVVCPTLTGPVSCAVFAMATIAFIPLLVLPTYLEGALFPWAWHVAGFTATGVAGSYAYCHVLRRFYRSVEVMQRQLLSLQMAELKCSCCSTGECVRAGGRMACDRQVISECISIWFGSTQNFAEYIRTEVVDVISEQLERNSFSGTWSVAVLSPAHWAILDIMQFEVRRPDPDWVFFTLWLSVSLTVWLICPIYTSWCKFLAYRLRHESSSRCGEVFTNLLMILCASPVVAFGVGASLVGIIFPPDHWKAGAVVAVLLPGWSFMWLLRRQGKGYLSQYLRQQRLEGMAQGSKHSL